MFFRGPSASHVQRIALPLHQVVAHVAPGVLSSILARVLVDQTSGLQPAGIRTHKLIKVLNHTTARLFHKVKVSKALLLYIFYITDLQHPAYLSYKPLTNKENHLPSPSFSRSCLSILLLHQAEVHQVHLFPQLEHVIRLPAHAWPCKAAVRSVEELNPGSEGKLHLTFRLKKTYQNSSSSDAKLGQGSIHRGSEGKVGRKLKDY